MIPSVFDSAQSACVSPWIVLDELDWAPLTEGLLPREYHKRQAVYYQEGEEDCIYLVAKGRINVSVTNSQGKIHSLYVADRGCLFGESFCYLPQISSTQASANCDSLVFPIPEELFARRIQASGLLMGNMLKTLMRKGQILTYHIEQLSFNDSFTKVKNVLLALADTYGQIQEGGILIHIRFTHQEVAEVAAVSRVTAANVMSSMQKAGVLSRRDGHAFIPDLAAFQRFCGPTP